MNNLKHFWTKVSRAGVQEVSSHEEQGRIIITNQICFTAGLFCIVFTLILWRSNILIGNLLQVSYFFVLYGIIYLNYLKKFLIGKLLLTFSVSFMIFGNASIMGFESGVALGFIPAFLATFIIYDLRNKWVNLFAFSIPVFFIIALELTDYSLLKVNKISTQENYIMFWYNYGVSLVMCTLIAVYFTKEAKRQKEFILQKEKELQNAKEKETNLLIAEEQDKYKLIFDTLEDVITVMDETGIMIESNAATEKTAGVPTENKIKDVSPFLTESAKLEFDRLIHATRIGEKFHTVTTLKRLDGSEFPMEIRSIPYIYQGKKYILNIGKDISEQVKAEKEIRQQQMDLQAVVTSLDDIVFESNSDYIFLNVWTKDETKLFMPKELFLGKPMKVVFGNEFCIPFEKAIDKVLVTGQSESLEYPSFINDGNWYEATVNLIKTADQNNSKVSLIIKNITARKREEEKVREKDKLLAESKMATLRSQMNPHFLFNSINSIQQLVLADDKNMAYDYFGRFSRLMRNILDHSDKMLVPLEDEIDTLKLYVEIEALRFEGKFEYLFNIDPELIESGCKIPPMLFQPFVENAIWHGLLNKTGDRKLNISLQAKDNNCMYCMIEDNGVGRKKAMEIKGENLLKHTSKGIDVTLDRIELLNSLYNNITGFRIIDLISDDKIPLGTKVEFVISLS